MTAIHAKVGALSLFVGDVARAKAFYQRVFDLQPLFEDETSCAFRFGDAILNLVTSATAPELIEPASVATAGAGSAFMLTIWVEDADAACADLAERGVTLLNGPIDRPWGVRTATFQDPDGHVWEVAQQLQ